MKMKNSFSWFVLLVICVSLCIASGDDAGEPMETPTESSDGWVYGELQYPHDVLDIRTLFMLLMGHPGNPVPMITGGYAETDVWAVVEIRGIDVPRPLQVAEDRHRPHAYLARERERWNRAMAYIWNICGNNRIFRVGNFEVIEHNKKLKADIEFLLGGQWHDLRATLLNDKLVLPTQADGTEWDFGAVEFGTLNPNVPK